MADSLRIKEEFGPSLQRIPDIHIKSIDQRGFLTDAILKDSFNMILPTLPLTSLL